MKVAYILVRVSPGHIEEVASHLTSIKQIMEVYAISGEYDIIAKALMENYDEIIDIVPHGVQRVKGVERTNTLFTFSAFM